MAPAICPGDDPEQTADKVGVKVFPAITGFAANEVPLVAVDTGVVTFIVPVETPAGVVAVICVALFTVNDAAATLLNVTAVAPVKLVPVIVTEVPPAVPQTDVGVKLVIVGGRLY